MALTRISVVADFAVFRTRFAQAAPAVQVGDQHSSRHYNLKPVHKFHVCRPRYYPEAPKLPLPDNISEIFKNETGRFTPERSRDLCTPTLLHDSNSLSQQNSINTDSHVDSYDCFGAISLNSSMQTNVPQPFCSTGKSTYLNMPGGQWAREGKYIAEDLQRLRRVYNGSTASSINMSYQWKPVGIVRFFSTISNAPTSTQEKKRKVIDPTIPATRKGRFERIVRDYGKTVLVFHGVISLISLGACYSAIASGVDVTAILSKFMENPDEVSTKVMSEGSTFLIAYAIHKLLMPIRVSITFGFTPILVKYLRKKGILKTPIVTPP